MQRADPALAIIGVLQRAGIWLLWYGIALAGFVIFVLGDLAFAVLLIVCSELLFIFWRPQPQLGPATYAPPMPAGWQGPIAAMRWLVLIAGFWSLLVGIFWITVAFVATAVVVFIVFLFWPHAFGIYQIAVAVLFTAWVSTRPLWIERLRKALKMNVNLALTPYLPSIAVTPDGIEIEIRFLVIGKPPQNRWHLSVPFADLEEVRVLDGLSAQGYMESLGAYDPTIEVRFEWEIWRFYLGKNPRPSVFRVTAAGAQLLLRGPALLYLIGGADQAGPVAVAAWNAWREAHAPSAAPTP